MEFVSAYKAAEKATGATDTPPHKPPHSYFAHVLLAIPDEAAKAASQPKKAISTAPAVKSTDAVAAYFPLDALVANLSKPNLSLPHKQYKLSC